MAKDPMSEELKFTIVYAIAIVLVLALPTACTVHRDSLRFKALNAGKSAYEIRCMLSMVLNCRDMNK